MMVMIPALVNIMSAPINIDTPKEPEVFELFILLESPKVKDSLRISISVLYIHINTVKIKIP